MKLAKLLTSLSEKDCKWFFPFSAVSTYTLITERGKWFLLLEGERDYSHFQRKREKKRKMMTGWTSKVYRVTSTCFARNVTQRLVYRPTSNGHRRVFHTLSFDVSIVLSGMREMSQEEKKKVVEWIKRPACVFWYLFTAAKWYPVLWVCFNLVPFSSLPLFFHLFSHFIFSSPCLLPFLFHSTDIFLYPSISFCYSLPYFTTLMCWRPNTRRSK